jgi:hypothetical protein
MKSSIRQFVVLANGELRIPEGAGQVAHGHRPPDEHIKIVIPANKNWVLVEVEVEAEEPAVPSIDSILRNVGSGTKPPWA